VALAPIRCSPPATEAPESILRASCSASAAAVAVALAVALPVALAVNVIVAFDTAITSAGVLEGLVVFVAFPVDENKRVTRMVDRELPVALAIVDAMLASSVDDRDEEPRSVRFKYTRTLGSAADASLPSIERDAVGVAAALGVTRALALAVALFDCAAWVDPDALGEKVALIDLDPAAPAPAPAPTTAGNVGRDASDVAAERLGCGDCLEVTL
jgi:hypothetical protein